MVDIIIGGESGKLHAVYHKSAVVGAPLAVVLSGNPRQKYHMNDRVSYAMFRAFMDIGFSVVRFNYRGVNDSEGAIGTTTENMLDIATVIDWIQNHNEDSTQIWLAGHQWRMVCVTGNDATSGNFGFCIGVAGFICF